MQKEVIMQLWKMVYIPDFGVGRILWIMRECDSIERGRARARERERKMCDDPKTTPPLLFYL